MTLRRQPIARSTKPIKRGRPIVKGRRPRKQRKGGKAALGRACDKLWSLIVRQHGSCKVCEKAPPAVVLQGAHGFSRRYRGTRWNLLNGFSLCSGCHVRLTHDPIGWDNWLRVAWGASIYAEMRRLAICGPKPDLAAVHASLLAEWNR
jgi:hypothetical protein